MKREKLIRSIKIQLLIFLILLIVAEIVLRCLGMKAGTLIDDFDGNEKPVYLKRFESDELGINHIYKQSETLMRGTIINEQGFRGKINYTSTVLDSIRKYTKRKIVMIVGDSFVEGCCVDSVYDSFPDILGRKPAYEILNFGVAGTDPLQYELVTKKYVKLLKPDIVIVVIYFGNDFLTYKREPSPGSPITFPFKKNKWIYAIAPNHLSKKMNYAFKTPEEAFEFYITHYTLKGGNRNGFEKTVAKSVLFSKLYLFIEHRNERRVWEKMNPYLQIDFYQIMNQNLKNILTNCSSANIPCLFTGIPSPAESNEGKTLEHKYQEYFKNILYQIPANLSGKDYDGISLSNHFNKEGHKKYAEFLNNLLQDHFKKNETKVLIK